MTRFERGERIAGSAAALAWGHAQQLNHPLRENADFGNEAWSLLERSVGTLS